MLSSFAWLFLSPTGRISRQEFWLGAVATIVVELLVMHVLQNAGNSSAPFYFTSGATLARYQHHLNVSAAISNLVANGILLWPRGALVVKRMHDLGLSGRWLLVWPAIVIFSVLTGLTQLGATALILALVVLGLAPGVHGVNRFGEDPLANSGQQLR